MCRLLDQINLQKQYLDQVSENIAGFNQQKIPVNCTCDDRMNVLIREDNAQKELMGKLQQQVQVVFRSSFLENLLQLESCYGMCLIVFSFNNHVYYIIKNSKYIKKSRIYID